MLGSAMVYSGGAAALGGVVSLVRPLRVIGIRDRRWAGGVFAAGLAVAACGALLPASLKRTARPVSLLDRIVPSWQFGERHEIRVHAPPSRVEAAVRAVTAGEIRFFGLLTQIRSPHLPWRRRPESILAAPRDKAILDVALSSGFLLLAEERGRELVFGTLVVVPPEVRAFSASDPDRLRKDWPPARVAALSEPGYAKAVMSFELHDEGNGFTLLATETRVLATDDATRRRFGIYWRVIYPGSALIRRMWLDAIRARAEGAPVAGADGTAARAAGIGRACRNAAP